MSCAYKYALIGFAITQDDINIQILYIDVLPYLYMLRLDLPLSDHI